MLHADALDGGLFRFRFVGRQNSHLPLFHLGKKQRDQLRAQVEGWSVTSEVIQLDETIAEPSFHVQPLHSERRVIDLFV